MTTAAVNKACEESAVSKAINRIRETLPASRIAENEPMSRHTSFRIGGPARALITAETELELSTVLAVCSSEPGLEYMMIGNGSNFLVADEGYPGIFIRLGGEFERIQIVEQPDTLSKGREIEKGIVDAGEYLAGQSHYISDYALVRVGAARLLSSTSSFLTEHGLTGFEFASGIPGSIGGAVFMNAGAYGGEISDVVMSVRLMKSDGSEVIELTGDEMEFGYRHSIIEENGMIVLSALMRFDYDLPDMIAGRVRGLQEKRNAKQPVNYPSAGSTFKRPVGGYAAALIDEAGLKGYTVGGAKVSEKHAGFVINAGGATAEDVLAVMRHVRSTVYANSGIMLEPEVRLIGCSL